MHYYVDRVDLHEFDVGEDAVHVLVVDGVGWVYLVEVLGV